MDNTNYLKSFFTEHWKYMAVNAACKINLFDEIGDQKYTATDLADKMEVNKDTLEFLLKSLLSIDFLEVSNDYYALNYNSILLQENHSGSLKYACMIWAEEHLTAWQNLDFSIKKGKSSFNHLYGDSYFDYLRKHPYKLDNYHKAMYGYARDDYAALGTKINFGKHNAIMDVGGGYGAAIGGIKNQYPAVNCTLFDLKEVILNCKLSDVSLIFGDFLTSVPSGSEAIILSRILHDWNDENTNCILKNCFEALPKNGTLYLIENCFDLIAVDLSLLSLNMTVMCESFERTLKQYKELCQNQGFIFDKTIRLNDLQTIIILTKP